jgi:hypothetical protein
MTGKVGLTVRQANLVAVKRERSVRGILHVGRRWLSVHPLLRRRSLLNELNGKLAVVD